MSENLNFLLTKTAVSKITTTLLKSQVSRRHIVRSFLFEAQTPYSSSRERRHATCTSLLVILLITREEAKKGNLRGCKSIKGEHS